MRALRSRFALPLALAILAHAGAFGILAWRPRVDGGGPPRRSAEPIGGVTMHSARQATKARGAARERKTDTEAPNEPATTRATEGAEGSGAISKPGAEGASNPGADAYANDLRERVGRALRFPLELRRRGLQGRVGVRMRLDALGGATATVVESSGQAELDRLALEAAQSAGPFPAPPGGALEITLPIEFRITH